MTVNLGDNTRVPARALASSIREMTGRDVTLTWGPPDPLDPPEVAWMCGYLTAALIAERGYPLDVVAAPVFPGSTEAVYHSVLVTGSPAISTLEDAQTARFVVNEHDSWSGHLGVLRALQICSLFDRFAEVLTSGSHERSIDMLVDGTGELAAIDSTIWEHRLVTDTSLRSLRVLMRTEDWPAPPFSIGRHVHEDTAATIERALIASPTEGLAGIHPIALEAYLPMLGRL